MFNVRILDGASKKSKRKKMQERKDGRRRTAFSRQFSHYLWPPKKVFQDGLKKVTLGIAEYRVYRSTVLESHAKSLILQRLLSIKIDI